MGKEEIDIKSISIEGNRWFQKTYGNTYHTVSALINKEYLVTVPELTYGYDNQFETTIAKEMKKLGVLDIGKDSFWRFCEDNNIEFSSVARDYDRKKDLKIEVFDFYKVIDKDSDIKFVSKSSTDFKMLQDMIEKKAPNDSNESKALKVVVEDIVSGKNISAIDNKIWDAYNISISARYPSLIERTDLMIIKEVVKAEMDGDLEFSYERELSKNDFYKGYKNILEETIKSLQKLGVPTREDDTINKRLSFITTLIEKLDSKNDESNKQSQSKNNTARR